MPFAFTAGLDSAFEALARQFPEGTFLAFGFNLRALLALLLVGLTCGAVGSLVVGGRMAFFSDALAHCSFAGVSLAFLLFLVFAGSADYERFWDWATPVMVGFGALVGFGIAVVRQQTDLSSDTVIGVFFAGAIGLFAFLRKLIARQAVSLEDVLFGDPLLVNSGEVLQLAGLAVVTAVALYFLYNHLLLTGFNPSLALSRRVPSRLANYLFVVLLAVIINLCLRYVGALLINALLVVPAATASLLARNMRQLFWLTVALCVGCCLFGYWLSWEAEYATRWRAPFGPSGSIILLSVALFTLALAAHRLRRQRRRAV
jgi:zinc transport system permease protein